MVECCSMKIYTHYVYNANISILMVKKDLNISIPAMTVCECILFIINTYSISVAEIVRIFCASICSYKSFSWVAGTQYGLGSPKSSSTCSYIIKQYVHAFLALQCKYTPLPEKWFRTRDHKTESIIRNHFKNCTKTQL